MIIILILYYEVYYPVLTVWAAKGNNWPLEQYKRKNSVMIVPIALTCSLKYARYLTRASKVIYILGFLIPLGYVGVLG